MKVPIFYASPNFLYYWNLRNLPIKHVRQGWTTLYLFILLNAININFSTHHLSTYVSYVNAQSAAPCKVERVMYGCNPSTQESKWKVIVSHRMSSSPSQAISKNKLGSGEMAKELRVLAAFFAKDQGLSPSPMEQFRTICNSSYRGSSDSKDTDLHTSNIPKHKK